MRRAVIALAFSASFAPAIALAAGATAAQRGSPPWPKFEIVMWQDKTEAQYRALAALGVTAAKVSADRAGEKTPEVAAKVGPILAAGLGFYVENIATDFYSAYHRWFPNRPVNWKFLAAKRQLAADPNSIQPFMRAPSLSDPEALASIGGRLGQSVRAYTPLRPLFFNLADESGIADLTAFWDFDFSPSSLAGFRTWLQEQYPSLAALNREWGTQYASWSDVVPETTTEAMRRSDGNYAHWSDFKAWMDIAFARAVRRGAAAVHAAAPWARAGLEGVQIPGWGGYDYSELAGAVDVMEMSTDDVALEIMRSLDPRTVLLSTSTFAGPREEHGVWQRVLLGTRGLVLWDDGDDFVRTDGTVEPRGEAAAASFAALDHGIGKVLVDAQPQYDPIAILYSPASFRLQWMLDRRAAGAAWVERQADTEDDDDALRVATRAALHGFERQGLHPRFVTEAQLGDGSLQRQHIRVLVLPETLALAPQPVAAISRFVAGGGRLAIIGQAGLFDAHGRQLERPPLQRVLSSGAGRVTQLSLDDIGAGSEAWGRLATRVGLKPLARVRRDDAAAVRLYALRDGRSTIVALQAELTPDGTQAERMTTVQLARPLYGYDLRNQRPLGRVSTLRLTVSSGIPSVVRLSDKPL